MTDYPIPDELRDRFSVEWGKAYYQDDDDEPDQVIVVVMDRLTRHGFHIELRLPEFAGHDNTCCGGTRRITRPDPRGGPLSHLEQCPGVDYYHWTVNG